MKEYLTFLSPAHIAGMIMIVAAAGAFFVAPGLAIALLLVYVVLCVLGCFFPQLNFLGPVISRGRSGKNHVALTFDDGPSEFTTGKILDVLDRYRVKATFFVSGLNALRHPDLIGEIIRRGHSIGNHSMRHDPLVMLKGQKTLEREVWEAQSVLQKTGMNPLAFRPPVGIVNPKLFPVLRKQGLLCVTFSCRARDAGNVRVKNLAERILKKVKGDDIILLHDKPARRKQDDPVFWIELDKILSALEKKGLIIVPLSQLIGRKLMEPVSPA